MVMKGQGRPHDKFSTPYRISALCRHCTKEKRGKLHGVCFNINCVCPYHEFVTALHARESGLRTAPKPGDFDFKEKR